MDRPDSHYHTLRVSPNATTRELEIALRQATLRYRKEGPRGRLRYVRAQHAFHILIDIRRRAIYNSYLRGLPTLSDGRANMPLYLPSIPDRPGLRKDQPVTEVPAEKKLSWFRRFVNFCRRWMDVMNA
jgi:curved DNA-binding protein CbpA